MTNPCTRKTAHGRLGVDTVITVFVNHILITCTYVFIQIHMCTHFYLDTYIYIYTYIYMYTHIHIHIHIHMHMYVYVHLHICIYIYVYIYLFIYNCICILHIERSG